MKTMTLLAATALAAAALPASTPAAFAQTVAAPTIEAGHTLLTVSAQGASTRKPDLATYTAGITTQSATASEALSANSAQMAKVIAALKRAGIADSDVQTSNLSVNPIYASPTRQPDGNYQDAPQRIVGYQTTNTVSVRQRKLADMGKVIDALVAAGANQVNGPNFQLSEPEAAMDEARGAAVKSARTRAEFYARAAGLRVGRIVSISESGGYAPSPVMYQRKAAMDVAAAPPVAAGELEINADVTVQFELTP